MAAAKQLRELLTAVRAECGLSTSAAHGLSDRETLVYLINRTQLDLWESFDWPFLMVNRDIVLGAGTRYYPFPARMAFEDVEQVYVMEQNAGIVRRLSYGIEPDLWTAYNSDTGARSWPPQRWQVDPDTGTIELWPVPDASATGAVLRLRGTLAPVDMVNDSDTVTLPWRIVVLTCAAEVLAKQEDPASQTKSQRAAELIRRLKVRTSAHKSSTTMGTGSGHARVPVAGRDYIPSGYGQGPRRS